jgi:hypothetical protein
MRIFGGTAGEDDRSVAWKYLRRYADLSLAARLGGLPLKLLLACFLLGNFAAVCLYMLQSPPAAPVSVPGSYSYHETAASNGVKLHTIRTTPQRIQLKAIAGNVTQTEDVGINGGFFWQGYLLSIAVMNDRPLKGQQGDYGSGWHNIDVPKGTLVWDEITRRFSVQVVLDASELKVTDKLHYWAQGGISMSLQDDVNWSAQAIKEDMPAFDQPRLRSGAIYDDRMNIYLLVTDTPSTAEQFRTAVKELLAGRGAEGIFLDGDGSSQLRTAHKQLKGDSREVYQMLSVRP